MRSVRGLILSHAIGSSFLLPLHQIPCYGSSREPHMQSSHYGSVMMQNTSVLMPEFCKIVGFKSVEYLFYKSDQSFVDLGHFGSNVGEVRMFSEPVFLKRRQRL